MAKKRTISGFAKKSSRAAAAAHANGAVLHQAVNTLLWLWGSNGFGQLGMDDDVLEKIRPTVLRKFGNNVEAVAAGGMHTLVLLKDGTLWTTGVNDEGALGRATEIDAEGNPLPGRDPNDFTQVFLGGGAAAPVRLACADSACFVVTVDGSVYGWGTFRNEHGVLGFSHKTLLQLTPTKVYAPSARASPVVNIAAGSNHVVAILQDGGALSWGDGDQGQLGRISLRHSRRPSVIKKTMLTPTKIAGCRTTKFVDVTCGEYSSFLRAANGHFFAFGLNGSGQLSIPLAADVNNEDILTLEGRVRNLVTFLTPTFVQTLADLNIVRVAAGKDHGLGLNAAGCLYSWGAPTYGVLGRADLAGRVEETNPLPVPARVSGFEEKTVHHIATGQLMSACIDSEGDLYTWGAALNDMLGYAGHDDVLVPKKVARTASMEGKKFRDLTFGGQHAGMLGE